MKRTLPFPLWLIFLVSPWIPPDRSSASEEQGAPTQASIRFPAIESWDKQDGRGEKAESTLPPSPAWSRAATRFHAFFGAEPPVPESRPAFRKTWSGPPGESLERDEEVGWDLAEPTVHETCHGYLAARVEGRLGPLGVGHIPESESAGREHLQTILPDWFEEGVASLCEDALPRRARLIEAISDWPRRIPLHRLMVMPRPGGDGSSRSADEGRLFENQSHALAAYLAEREGSRMIGRLGDLLMKGRATSQALREFATVPSDLAALEEGLYDWLEESAVMAPVALHPPESEQEPPDLHVW